MSYHGTPGGYTNHKCRCDECRRVWRSVMAKAKEKYFSMPTPDHVHGTSNGYGNYGCRCRDCTDAYTSASRRWRAKSNKQQRTI